LEGLEASALVIMDDLANELFASKKMSKLFLQQSHHENVGLGLQLSN
jgi:hypothetical protein